MNHPTDVPSTAPTAPGLQAETAQDPERISALFDQLVQGHMQMALMFLGRLPNPHTGEIGEVNLDAAQIFIEQLEMLEVKTQGNLSNSEARTLGQALAATRMGFVAVVDPSATTGPGKAVGPSSV